MKNIKNIILGGFALLFSFLFPLYSFSKPIKFIVNDELGRDNVSFTSDAPIELVVGRTNKINGTITIDDSLDLNKGPFNISFDVDLSSIDTGIPLRNEHMRDNFLETKKFPKAIFKVTKIVPATPSKLLDSKSQKLMAEGDLNIHGVAIKKKIPVKVTYLKESEFTHSRFEHGDVIKIQSTFDVPLEEHKIKRPEVIFQKLADTVIVTIDAYAVMQK